MKLPPRSSSRKSGFALLMVIILAAASIVILAGVMYRSHTIAILNQRNNSYNTCNIAAEAAVEKVFARLAYDFQANGLMSASNNLSLYRTNIPTAAEDPSWSQFVFSDGQGNVGKTYVNYAYSYTGPLPSAYSGLNTANAPVYRIVSNVQLSNSLYTVTGTAQEDVLLALVPLNTWAIFYNGLLEFTQCATMQVNGPVMANGSIYVGTTAGLTFNSGVSTSGTLTAPLVDGLGNLWTPSKASTWGTTFKASPGYSTNNASVTVSLNMTNSHYMIDVPPSTESPTSETGQQRLYNEAQMVLMVTNSTTGTNPTVTLSIRNSINGQVPGNDPTPTVLSYTNLTAAALNTNLPFLSLTNISYDQRETDTNIFTQIDISKLGTWMATNTSIQGKLPASAGLYPTILYVADRRPITSTKLSSVRLINGAKLPSNGGLGFTVATMNPLYVQGDYNVQTSAGKSTGTANTYEVPAALMSDALTILSANWNDSQGFSAYSSSSSAFKATTTTINAAIVTGTVPSTGTSSTTFSGGVHNLTRLLENWSSANLYLNTSILRLWNSTIATNQFRNPAGFSPAPTNPYYNPPTRYFSYDHNFLNPAFAPPGIPTALVPIRFSWAVPPPGVTTYNPVHN